ncbi:MAG: heparan-alpha-glucosaminide N-acetyltransferase, partial [Beijerinckiaceae bacterium]
MASATARDPRVDLARGVAVLAMVAYHIVWDLAAFNLVDPGITATPAFRWSGALIASTFLFLSGMALVMAHAATTDASAFRARFLKRFAIIAGAALLVSIGTWFAMSDRFVRFGILHCIALSSLIAWPLLARPAPLIAGLAALFAALPWIAASGAFDG